MLLYLGWFFASVVICYTTLLFKRKHQMFVATIYLMALAIFVGISDMLAGLTSEFFAFMEIKNMVQEERGNK